MTSEGKCPSLPLGRSEASPYDGWAQLPHVPAKAIQAAIMPSISLSEFNKKNVANIMLYHSFVSTHGKTTVHFCVTTIVKKGRVTYHSS